MVRMTNIVLAPHEGTLASIVADTRTALRRGMRSWSIDDHRLNFQFGRRSATKSRTANADAFSSSDLYRRFAAFLGFARPRGGHEDFVVWGRRIAARASRNKSDARRTPAACALPQGDDGVKSDA